MGCRMGAANDVLVSASLMSYHLEGRSLTACTTYNNVNKCQWVWLTYLMRVMCYACPVGCNTMDTQLHYLMILQFWPTPELLLEG